MKKFQVAILKKALALLQQEFGKTRCKEKCAGCMQCWVDIAIIQLDAIIALVDEEQWKKKGSHAPGNASGGTVKP